ncbi:universal stress protein [Lacinutrix sp. Hel_I_90]|uniref:universal stress protein n=1 Tax=Lacinutrix sp. Hel_I_90 TaxID=1249999 RepID=UPI0005C98492|nr:universal stress protein [Lacinutrix sp. Hel_I_90]
MKNILIPTDFSDNAMNALKYALELFKYERAEFYFLHAYEDEIYSDASLLNSGSFEDVVNRVKERSQDYLKSFLEAAKTIAPNPKYTYHTVCAYNSLIDEADKIVTAKNIDLIIMGTRGKSNAKEITFGSHTLQVLKYVQCPVLAIPEHYQYKQPKHIVFTTNFMIPYKRRELKLISEIATPYRAVIDLLYVSKNDKLSRRQEDNKAFIIGELPKTKVNFIVVDNKNMTNAIYIHMKENDTDLLVMVNTRRSFLENLLFASAVDKMTLHIDVPFLALQNMRRDY